MIHRHGSIDELSYESEWKQPVAGEGDAVVKVMACALNYHDMFTLRGMPGIKVPMPIIMGLDMAGVVVSTGPGVTEVKVGDRVMADPIDRERGVLLGEMMDGGLAEYCVVGAHTLVVLPESISFTVAAALPVAYGTAYRMMGSRGNIQPGEKVLILGASGGVGTCCVQLAKLAGAHVIVAASTSEKLERLMHIGADEGINHKTDNFMKVVHERFGKPLRKGGGGVDVIVNFTGGDTWVPSLRSLRKGGRLLTCGATAGFDPQTDIRYIWTFELDIKGSNGWDREGLLSLLELVRAGKLKPLIDRAMPLSETRQAFHLLESRKVFGKIIIEPAR